MKYQQETNEEQGVRVISREESRIELVDILDKDGAVLIDENGQPVKEEREIIEEKEFVQVVVPQKVVEHKKDEYVAQLESRLAIYQAEVARNQEMVDGLQAELLELTTPNEVK